MKKKKKLSDDEREFQVICKWEKEHPDATAKEIINFYLPGEYTNEEIEAIEADW